MSSDRIHEPVYIDSHGCVVVSLVEGEVGARISGYLQACAGFARAAFTADRPAVGAGGSGVVEAITGVLLSHEFNHQSRGKVAHLVPAFQRTIAASVARSEPIQLFMSYNGGYHATTRPDFSLPLGFDVGATELLFLYLIARLKHRLTAVYSPGIVYHVVLNNGVAHYVNDIPLERTEAYARQLEDMIAALGGQSDIRVLVQSRCGDFAGRMSRVEIAPAASIDALTHRNIERFLGRPCDEAEARLRLGRYAPAEAAWWEDLRGIIAAADGVRLLQVASPQFLSFRPFPGGATRAQTGQVGFRIAGDKVTPVLVTTTTASRAEVAAVPVRWPSLLVPRPAVPAPVRIRA